MAVVANSYTLAYNVYKSSIENLSTDQLENHYLHFKVSKLKSNMTILTITALALSIVATCSGNLAVGIGLFVFGVGLGVHFYFQSHKDDLKLKVLEDIFLGRGKRAVFQSSFGGLSGFSLHLEDVRSN